MCGKITPEKRGGKKKEQIKIKQDATNVREDHILKNRKEKQMNKKGCQNTRSFWLTQKKKKKEVLVFPKKKKSLFFQKKICTQKRIFWAHAKTAREG